MAELRPVVYHVGRSGDVPGGMTQVINAYLDWDFANCDVEVIESRGEPGDHVAAAEGFIRTLLKLRRIADAGRPAVIVVHLSERGSFVREGLIARYAARRRLPVIAHLHGADFATFEQQHSRLVGRVLAAATHVITLSTETSAICAKHRGLERVDLVPNAIPAGNDVEKERLVVFGGVVSHRKGIDVLQEAWRDAAPSEGWTLKVAGPIRDGHLVDRELAHADFLGRVGHDDLLELLDRAAIAVLPSRDEAMPMFILEAMARRACVVSTVVGGIPAVLSDGCGMLSDPGDVDALADILRSAMTDDVLRNRVAEAGFQRFEAGYSAETVFPRVERIWLDALLPGSAPTGETRVKITTRAKGVPA